LEALLAYGADIYVLAEGKETLLWAKQVGYTKLGKGLLPSSAA